MLKVITFIYLATFFFLSGSACTNPPPSTCPGSNPIIASAEDRDYELINKGLKGEGVLWAPSFVEEDTVVTLRGSSDGCMYRGGIKGAVPFTAVYECGGEHCPPGGCPTPCFEYHTYKGVRNYRSTGSETLYQGVCVKDSGDGFASGDDYLGDIIDVRDSYFDNIHDDVLEQDWGCTMIARNALVERAFMIFAMNPRESDNVDLTGCTIQSYGNLFRLFKFPNTYKQKGPGGLTKTPNGPNPKMIVRDTKLWIDAPHGNGQEIVPSPSRLVNTEDCQNNTYYFNGDAAQYEAFLADEDGIDGLTNGERLSQLSYCITVIPRPEGWTSFDFLFEYWFPLVDAWKTANTADNGC